MKRYIIGFGLSIFFTLAAYALVFIHVNAEHESISHQVLIPAILIFAAIQMIVQLIFFLHLGFGSRSELVALISTVLLVLIVVVGSIWIMNHLNYNMTPDQIQQYIQDQQGF